MSDRVNLEYRGFVYMVITQDKDSMAAFSSHVSNKAPTTTGPVFSHYEEALEYVWNIYSKGLAGVKYDAEHVIIKKEICGNPNAKVWGNEE